MQETRDWAASTLEGVVAAACHYQMPAAARGTLFAACNAAELLDEGDLLHSHIISFDMSPKEEVC